MRRERPSPVRGVWDGGVSPQNQFAHGLIPRITTPVRRPFTADHPRPLKGAGKCLVNSPINAVCGDGERCPAIACSRAPREAVPA